MRSGWEPKRNQRAIGSLYVQLQNKWVQSGDVSSQICAPGTYSEDISEY